MTRHGEAPAVPVLATRALVREAARARRLLDAGEWRPAPEDADAAAAVLARLTAPLPGAARVRDVDRDRRLQRVFRTTLHHLDAGAVTPAAAALLAAVARALLPWHAHPNPPVAAAAPRYGAPGPAPTAAGEALLPGLIALFTALAATNPSGTVPRTPPAVPWQVPYTGSFRRHSRPAPGVWAARTVACRGCGGTTGPWTVVCDWRLSTLCCRCGAVDREHGLALSEVWLPLPDA
ncbi:hypothetical protein [Streptomyces sp. NPDC050585]|uniref:hypothetical protein n=1 Tax=Streptomyces sp. NPDC050585 TaxID=3365632 RepID=UPI00379E414F